MIRINNIERLVEQSLLKQYLFGLLRGSFFALSLQAHAMQVPISTAQPNIVTRVTRANFLIKELYWYKKGDFPLDGRDKLKPGLRTRGERSDLLLTQSDRRNFRKILLQRPNLLLSILRELHKGNIENAHTIVRNAYKERWFWPNIFDFTLKDFASAGPQAIMKLTVSKPEFNFLEKESAIEIAYQAQIQKKQADPLAQAQAAESQPLQEQRELETRLQQQALLARGQQEAAAAQAQRQKQQQIDAESKKQAELAAQSQAQAAKKINAKQPEPRLSKQQKEVERKRLLAERKKLQGYITAAKAEQADLMPPARLTEPEAYAWLSKLSDAQQNRASSIGDEIGRMEDDMVQLGYELEKLEYPDNVTQYRLVPQKNNDCGFRSARHAVLGYLYAIGKIDDKDFVNAIEVDEDAILSINDLKNLVKEDRTLMFPRPADPNNPGQTVKEYATDELQLEKIVAVACRWPKLDTAEIETSNISILPLILGIRNPDTQFAYAFTDAIRAKLREIRNSPDFVHAFILNADQSARYEPRVTHWLPIIVEKKNGAYFYTILDSLNKSRNELVGDLMYFVEQHPLVE